MHADATVSAARVLCSGWKCLTHQLTYVYRASACVSVCGVHVSTCSARVLCCECIPACIAGVLWLPLVADGRPCAPYVWAHRLRLLLLRRQPPAIGGARRPAAACHHSLSTLPPPCAVDTHLPDVGGRGGLLLPRRRAPLAPIIRVLRTATVPRAAHHAAASSRKAAAGTATRFRCMHIAPGEVHGPRRGAAIHPGHGGASEDPRRAASGPSKGPSAVSLDPGMQVEVELLPAVPACAAAARPLPRPLTSRRRRAPVATSPATS